MSIFVRILMIFNDIKKSRSNVGFLEESISIYTNTFY